MRKLIYRMYDNSLLSMEAAMILLEQLDKQKNGR